MVIKVGQGLALTYPWGRDFKVKYYDRFSADGRAN